MTERTRQTLFLRTFGAPDLLAGSTPLKLRAKDLALLAYLRLHPPGAHRRSVLAALLWAENSEQGARHSLTQAVVRLRKVLGAGAIDTTRDTVVWSGPLACDAAQLEEAAREDRPSLLEEYEGEFLAGLGLGAGTQAFENWAAARRVDYRDMAADLMDRWGADAERRGDWQAALRFGQRETEIDPYHETGHRRVMRALDALGERNRALLHYAQYAGFVLREMGLAPQSETTALADALRASGAPPEPDPRAETPSPEPEPARAAPDASQPPHCDRAAPPPCKPDPRACPHCTEVSAAIAVHASGRRWWLTAGVIAASVTFAVVLARAGVRAT
jgi:DNA-binding SARP family transcriptional activator